MRERALVHVAGPPGVGKTTLIERILEANIGLTICVRAERDVKLTREVESAPKSHAELRRYRDAGACDQAVYRFSEPSIDSFFATRLMEGYSQAVVIEGDCPVEYVDLFVFVTQPLQEPTSLLRRVAGERAAARRDILDRLSPEFVAGLSPAFGELLRQRIASNLSEFRPRPRSGTTHWELDARYSGIERAQLVVINVRSNDDRDAAAALLQEIGRLRADDEVFRDVMRFRGNKLPITAVIADLSDPKNPGLKKAVARVKRGTKQQLG